MPDRVPGVYPSQGDGGLSAVGASGVGARVVVGVSSFGTLNSMLALTDTAQVIGLLGYGPLARAVADQLAFGGGVVYAVRATSSGGSVTPDPANPASPVVTVTGTPLDAYDVQVRVTLGGALGTSRFQVSLDGGDTFTPDIATAATYPIPNTGLTLNFAVGAYVLNNVYRYAVLAPTATVANIQTAIRAALNSGFLYEFIQVAQACDAATWAALDALCVEAETAFRYIFMACETTAPAADPDAWVNARVLEIATFSSRRVVICAAFGEVIDTLTGQIQIQSLASRIFARVSGNPVQRKAARIRDGALPGIVTLAPFTLDASTGRKTTLFNNGHSLALENARFLAVYQLRGAAGFYVSEDRTAALDTSDYKLLPNVRVMNRAITLIRQSWLLFVQDEVDPVELTASIGGFLAAAMSVIRSMRLDGSLSTGRVIFPPGQNPLSDQRLRFRVRLTPKAYAREIVFDVQFENPTL